MKHSIITWDSCFRNFFHLLPSLADCAGSDDGLEVVVVEQRSAAASRALAAREQVQSLESLAASLRGKLDIKLIFLDEADNLPYHPGRLLNAGLLRAEGEILSTMDVDILVPPNFLKILLHMHAQERVVLNLHRWVMPHPCGVSTKNWKNQFIDYGLMQASIPVDQRAIPGKIGNKAPLISARREDWAKIGYYDGEPGWSTACTLFGQDVCRRFALLLGPDKELAMPIACLHPWHPVEVNRLSEEANLLYSFQQGCMARNDALGSFRLSDRMDYERALFQQYQQPIQQAIHRLESAMRQFTPSAP
jgi:hypothetical protein